MPRFAANLGYLFTEQPLLGRIEAAAQAGFRRSSCNFPMTCRRRRSKRRSTRNKPHHARRQHAARDARASSAMPRCRAAKRTSMRCLRRALDYITAIGGSAIHCLAGKVAPEQRPAAERVYIENLKRAAELAAAKNITLLIEPINARDRPDYFLNHVEHAADVIAQRRQAQYQDAVRFLSRADRRRRSAPPAGEIPGRGRPSAMRRGADAARAGRGRDELSATCSPPSTGSATAAGSAPSIVRAAGTRPASAGRGPMAWFRVNHIRPLKSHGFRLCPGRSLLDLTNVRTQQKSPMSPPRRPRPRRSRMQCAKRASRRPSAPPSWSICATPMSRASNCSTTRSIRCSPKSPRTSICSIAAVSRGDVPRLWIDVIAHVEMGRDKRQYRFVQDTRYGRAVLAESYESAGHRAGGDALCRAPAGRARARVRRRCAVRTRDRAEDGRARAAARGGWRAFRTFIYGVIVGVAAPGRCWRCSTSRSPSDELHPLQFCDLAVRRQCRATIISHARRPVRRRWRRDYRRRRARGAAGAAEADGTPTAGTRVPFGPSSQLSIALWSWPCSKSSAPSRGEHALSSAASSRRLCGAASLTGGWWISRRGTCRRACNRQQRARARRAARSPSAPVAMTARVGTPVDRPISASGPRARTKGKPAPPPSPLM